MNRRNMQQYQMLTRVVDFGTRHVGSFPKNTVAPEILSALSTAVATLSDRATSRVVADAAMKAKRRARIAARGALKTLLEQAGQTGTALQIDSFQTPRGRSDQAMIDSGHAFALAAEPLKKEFAKHGLPQFADTIAAAVEKLENAILDCSAGRAAQSIAIGEFDRTMDEALRNLQRLDAVVANTLNDDSPAMASWIVARSVNHIGGRKATPAPVPPVPPAPVIVVPAPPVPAPSSQTVDVEPVAA